MAARSRVAMAPSESRLTVMMAWDALNSSESCQDVGLICPFVVIDPTDLGATSSCSELAPGQMFDNFLPIPDAESLPFYPLVLKLVVCGGGPAPGRGPAVDGHCPGGHGADSASRIRVGLSPSRREREPGPTRGSESPPRSRRRLAAPPGRLVMSTESPPVVHPGRSVTRVQRFD